MLRWNVKCILLVTGFVSLCNAQRHDKKDKNMAVKEIVQKIYNLTSKSLLNGSPDEKEEMFKSIKTKLARSAEPLGAKADKYVDIIMRGIKLMARNNKPLILKEKKVSKETADIRTGNKNEPVETTDSNALAKKMASKIFKLAQKHFRRAKSDKERHQIIDTIKKRVMERAKQKHDLIHNKHDEIKTYTDLVSRGMELMMNEITQKKRRMIMEIVNNKVLSNHNEENIEDEYKQLEQRTNFLGNANVQKSKLETRNEHPTVEAIDSPFLTTPFSCQGVLTQTCAEIKSLNEFVCDSGVKFPLNKLCDGVSDCFDGSDERSCFNEATKLLRRATEIMSRIEIYLLRKCFLTEDNSMLIKQNWVLNDVLKGQISFLNKHKYTNVNDNDVKDVYAFKRSLNEVAMVIKTFSIGLESSLCNRYLIKRKAESMSNKYIPDIVDNLDEFSTQPHFPLKNCKCHGSFCANHTCPEVCKRVCWNKYNLGKWSCQAVDEANTVSLDVICDGKLDCYDETDESGCYSGVGPARFEANDVFQKILSIVEHKITSEDYLAVQTKLLSLQNSIKQLQAEVMKSNIDVINIKNARHNCFSILSSIYEDFLEEDKFRRVDLEKVHFFLFNVNEQLMIALKHSHTGNDKVILPDGCYCRDGKCAATKCTNGCIRACSVQLRLTEYACKVTANKTVSLPIGDICNGKANCPLKDDEADCSKEICRKHHLILLRHNIRDVGENRRGNSVGEVLRAWKNNVSSKLKLAESNHRPSRFTILDLINDSLQDLVMSYASLEENQKTRDFSLREFFKASQLVIGAAKSCGQ